MKKLFLLASLAICIHGCSNQNSYKISGTVENSLDGDSVFILKVAGRELVKESNAVVENGKFTFEGKQDSTVNRYISYAHDNRQYMTDFFLENGNITINLAANSEVNGTISNNTYQSFKDKVGEIRQKQQDIYDSLQDTTLTDEQRNDRVDEIRSRDTDIADLIYKTIDENIDNTVGLHLFERYSPRISLDKTAELLEKVPAKFENYPHIIALKEQVEIEKNVAIGKKFTDLEMPNPEGDMVSLSDYVYKSKYTLVDFWASWCGPCRQEMPTLVDAYKKYHNKGFEIVGISFDKDLASWKEGINTLKITWPQMSDLKFWQSEGARLYSVRGIPHTVLIDNEGIIIAKDLRGEELEQKLAELFK